jgi:Glycosyl hydrolase family 10
MAANRSRESNLPFTIARVIPRSDNGRLLVSMLLSMSFAALLFILLPAKLLPYPSRWSGLPDAQITITPIIPAQHQANTALMRVLPPAANVTAAGMPIIQGNQGLQYGAVIDDSGHILLQDESLQLMAQAGAGWIKINFRLGGFANWTETTTFGYSAISLYDQIVANARSRNLKVLGELSNESWHGTEPQWQENSAESVGGNGNNQYIQQFAQNAAVVLTQHYAGQIDEWEVWNEPSQPNTYMHPSNFAQLLAQVYTKTKATGATSVRFVSGGITSFQDPNGNITLETSGADYLRQVYVQGQQLAGWKTIRTQYGSYPLDMIGQHIYLDGTVGDLSTNIRTALQLLHDAYVDGEGGNTTKQTIITESGWATGSISEGIHANCIQTAYTTFKMITYIRQAYWFFLRDESAPGLYFGLLRADSSQKPAWDAYHTYANY